MTDDETLYDRLGGREAIRAVVDDFYDRLLDDDELGPFFENTDMESLKEHQTDHLCEAAGGPAEYTGPPIREAHLHVPFTLDLIQRSVEHLEASLDAFDVTGEDREAVVAAVAQYEDDLLATADDSE
ncbi:group I truncated hemoglobin [Halorientalis salina]|uniref:group I truncated hemoglobin n=1 Tax=Halorientalis salina TaxID=2932266 RepID=UPI0010AD4181|nr:group 1 truncated hemoglobin [Halorientalis salina]